MPAFSLPGLEAFEQLARNPRSRWAKVVGDSDNAPGGPCFRPILFPKFRISKLEPAFAIGSCFAQEVQLALLRQGFRFVSLIEDPPDRGFFMQEVNENEARYWPLHFFHRYNVPSMLQEIRRLIYADAPLNDDALLFQSDNGKTYDFHYHHHFPSVGVEGAMARRQFIREQFRNLQNCRVMIVTLGLTEAWYDSQTELYLNITPNYKAMQQEPDRFKFVVLNVDDVRRNLRDLLDEVKGYAPGIKFIITVSPIPLDATFAPNDIVVSTSHSKATLITAAREIAYADANVDYFPSYEMVNMSSRAEAWTDDHRHVRPEFVENIMEHFAQAYLLAG